MSIASFTRTIENFKKKQGEIYDLQLALEPRRIKLPDQAATIVTINTKWNKLDLYSWLHKNTSGRIYISYNRFGFENKEEATMFALKFQ